MVKKTGKGKEKKLARKAATERAAALAAQIRALEAGSAVGADLAEQYPAFLWYRRNGLACVLRFFSAAELPAELAEWALSLTRAHMADLYNACPGWGWSDAKKRAELTHPSARLLVLFEEAAPDKAALPSKHCGGAASSSAGSRPSAAAAAAAGDAAARQSGSSQENAAAAGNGGGGGGTHAARCACCEAARGGDCVRQWHQDQRGQPVAFLHYRFEEEEGEAVLYCYEIQVAQAAQGKGVGRFLMQLLELMGRRCGVARLMLTVFHANAAAVALYHRLGYVLDDGSPGAIDPTGGHRYEIMTKRLQPPHRPAQQEQEQLERADVALA